MTPAKPKIFNVTGPCDPLNHYALPSLPRIPDVPALIDNEEYFVLHAPHQSGKTTAIMTAVKRINEEGSYYALYCTLEELCSTIDEEKATRKIVGILNGALRISQVEALKSSVYDGFLANLNAIPGFKSFPVQVWLNSLCEKLDKDLVVFFDEVDSLIDQPLVSFLSQLRAGYVVRTKAPFPRSIALVGARNFLSYKVKLNPEAKSFYVGDCFNIVSKTLTLANFTDSDVKALYSRHTEATGQVFLDEAVQRAFYWSEGQPWFVNALARETIEEILSNDYRPDITAELIDRAADNLMERRDTHIDFLLDKLHVPQVKRIIEPMLAASSDSVFLTLDRESKEESFNDTLQYCLYLGLLKINGILRPANPIYASAIVRFLSENLKYDLPKEIIGKWMDAKNIDMTGLLKDFQEFWAINSEKFLRYVKYPEAGPLLILSAFLQKALNGRATVVNEFANGQGYADIAVFYADRYYPIELKIKENQDSLYGGQKQILRYMERLLAKEGWLVIFDRKSNKSWGEKFIWDTMTTPECQTIHIVGC
jgi:hypothetical protein